MKMKRDKRNLPTVFNKDDDYYKQDWQDYYPTVIRLVPPNSYVLDVGCGRGGLLEYLQKNKSCRVVGVDISDDAITACEAKGIKTLKCDVEEDEIPGTYDVVILSAVLEHLIDPLSVLSKLREDVNNNGYLIVGVPNFSHSLARIQYLLGKNVKRFGDTEIDKRQGIQPLDHVQFFNKVSLSQVLEKTEYKPIEWSYHRGSYSKNPKASPHRMVLRWLIYKLYQLDHELFSVFIAVKAVKK